MSVTFETGQAIQDYFDGKITRQQLPSQVAKLIGTGLLPGISHCWGGDTAISDAFRYSRGKTEKISRRIVKLIEDGGDLNQRDRYGEPALFRGYDAKTFTLAVERGADPNLRDVKGQSCWRAFVSRLNTSASNDLPERTVPVLVECMRLTCWEDNLQTRQELMAFESSVPHHWKTEACFWDELWGKSQQQQNLAATERAHGIATEVYLQAYHHGLLFISLPCHHAGRQYWEAQRQHVPACRVRRQTPPLFGILLLCDPSGRALLREWIQEGKVDPSKPNKDGRNMLYSAVLADAGQEFCRFLEKRGVVLDFPKELIAEMSSRGITPVQARLIAAAKLAQSPLEIGMVLTLWARSNGTGFHNFWKEQIEKVGLANLLVLDHDAVDTEKILSTKAVRKLDDSAFEHSAHQQAVFTLWTDPRTLWADPRALVYGKEDLSLYLVGRRPSRSVAKQIYEELLQNKEIANRATSFLNFLISECCFVEEVAPDKGAMELKDFFLLQLMQRGAAKEHVQTVSNSYSSAPFVAEAICLYPELAKKYFPCLEWSIEVKTQLQKFIKQAYGSQLKFVFEPHYLAPILLKGGSKQELDSHQELLDILAKEETFLIEREAIVREFSWSSGLFAEALEKDPYLWLSLFKLTVPGKENIKSLTNQGLAAYRQLLLAYHAEEKDKSAAFDAIDTGEFVTICCQRGALGPLLPLPVWRAAWALLAEKRGMELAEALFQTPTMARQIAENYLSADSIELRKDGHSWHSFSTLAVPFLKGFLKNYSYTFRGKNDLYELKRGIAGHSYDGDQLPVATERLPELETEKVEAFALGHILFFPSDKPKSFQAYRFCRPGESTYLQVVERLNSHVYRNYFSAPLPVEEGFHWVKEVPSWIKNRLKGQIKPQGPYLISTYEVEAKQLERLSDPALEEERFQSIRSEILATEAELILSEVDQRRALGRDTLLLDMLHLRVVQKQAHPEGKQYGLPEGRVEVQLHRGGARSSQPREPHPLEGRLLGHSSFILGERLQSDLEGWDESLHERLCEDWQIMGHERYLEARKSMNRIARLLRQDGRWLIDRLKARKRVDYRDEECIDWLAKELERGVARVLTNLTGREEQSRRFCQEGPFHWEQAARQLAYWNMTPRPELPKDLYPAHVTVEVDSQWDGVDGPEPCLAIEEIWYHASFFGYILAHIAYDN